MKIEVAMELPKTGIGKVDSSASTIAETLRENIHHALNGISDVSEISNVATRLFSFDDLVIKIEHNGRVHRYVVKSVSTTLMNSPCGGSHVIRRYKYYIDHSRESRAVGIPPVDSLGHHSTIGGHSRD